MSTPVTPDTEDMATAAIAPFALANNQFSLDLYGQLIATKPRNENGFLSPFSVLAALSMVNVGAKGKTREQILKATHLNQMSNSAVDNAFKSMFTQLAIQTSPGKTPTAPRNEWERQTPYLAIANRIYLQKGFSVKKDFGDVLKNFYQTTIGEADFAGNSQGATREVNQWVESVTNNRIQNLFDKIEPGVKLALVSAIYFKAEWEDLFSEQNTQPGDFFGEGKTVKVPFMKQTDDDAKFAAFPDVDATGMLKSYAQGSVHMLFILPNKKDGLAALEKKLRPAHFDVSKYQTAEVEITLPKFKIESDFNLNAALKQIGIVDAFTDSADFTGISTQPPLKISEAIHKTFVEVNEKGTEAAAATGLKMVPLSAIFFPEDMKKVFKADHPFLFAIQHRETGAVLFIGRVSNPTPA